MKLIDIENLTLEIKDKKIVKNLDLFVNSGEIVAIAGESGSGKTMTIRAILDILPRKTKVSFDRFSKNCNIGAVFQNAFTSLNPTVKIGHQLKKIYEGHYPKSSDWETKAIDLLTKLGLKEPHKVLKKYSFETSGGERQRVVIAGALLSSPQLIIADEVTTALDLKTKKEVLELFREVQKSLGVAILFISHDLESIKGFAKRVYVMYHGVMVESGDVSEIFERPQNEYTQKLIGLSKSLWTRGQDDIRD